MSLRLELSPDLESRLRQQAARRGLSVRDYALSLLQTLAGVFGSQRLIVTRFLPTPFSCTTSSLCRSARGRSWQVCRSASSSTRLAARGPVCQYTPRMHWQRRDGMNDTLGGRRNSDHLLAKANLLAVLTSLAHEVLLPRRSSARYNVVPRPIRLGSRRTKASAPAFQSAISRGVRRVPGLHSGREPCWRSRFGMAGPPWCLTIAGAARRLTLWLPKIAHLASRSPQHSMD